MQSWSANGQTGADDQWQASYGFNGQNGQFDPHQPWGQSMGDQNTFHLNPQDGSPSAFFDSPHQGDAFLSGNLHGSTTGQQFHTHTGHDSLALNQQFSQAAQDVIDPAFSDMHPDLYGQQGKLDLGNSLNHLGNVQPSTHSQNFQYSFAPQNEQSYGSPIQQYTQPHVIPPQSRQQSHTPVQQFEGLQAPFTSHAHGYNRPPQQSPVQNQQNYTQSAFQPPINGQPSPYQTNAQSSYQQPQPQTQQQQQQPPQQQQSAFSPPPYLAQKPLNFVQPTQGIANQSFQHSVGQQANFSSNSPSPATAGTQYMANSKPLDLETATPPPVSAEPPVKKRKRAVKSATDVPTPESTVSRLDSPVDTSVKKVDEIDAIPPPTPSPEESQAMAQFSKRTKAAQAKQPSIKGLPYLLFDPSTKLPAPKSYDKLAPLVALPSRSGKAIVPELGYSLPCEVQGRFTSQYRPAPDRGGLDERRIEAKVLLDEFDRSMKGLGKRRPKYTEYPHAFKEQLKSDEAYKNKAEKKAKKELEEERNKPARPATRPLDPAEAAAWDIVGIVNIQPGVSRTSALIASRVQQAGEYIIKLRGEINRSKQEMDQAIKDKEPEAELAKIRQESEQHKEALYRALDAMLEHADDAVLDNLGGHQKLVLSLINALIMCIKSSDFSGKLPKIVFELFTHFPMTKKIAEATNFDTVRKRFADKGDEEIKGFVHEISVKIKKVLKAVESETSTGYTGTSAASRAKAATKSSADSSAKRSRDDDSDVRTVKKIAVESTGSSLSKKLARPKIQLQSASKTTPAKALANSILPGKSRPVAKSVPRSDTSNTDNKSSSDDKSKTDTKNGHKVEASKPVPKTDTKHAVPKAASSVTSSALSGIASLLDSINAPKAESPVVTPKDLKVTETSETPEEREKRLRKEARRKLRVSWKPESELVQVKIFQKEEAEDEGRDSNMIRDAADDRSEGMVLKQRANVEEEDDDDDIPYQPWIGPNATDFSNLREEARSKNFVTRGGKVTFSTDEQQRIKEREQRELIFFYSDYKEIPPTPKSPPPEMVVDSQSKVNHLPTDDPKFQEVQLRWRDEQQMGIEGALYAATKRLDARSGPSNRLDSILGRLKDVSSSSQSSHQSAFTAQQTSGSGHFNVPLVVGRAMEDQVLDMLRTDKIKNWQDPNPSHSDPGRTFHYADPNVSLCGNAIEIVSRSLVGHPYPAASPPDWIKHDIEKVREWQLGYSKEVAAWQRQKEEERAKADAEANILRAATAQAASAQPSGTSQDQWAAYYAQQQAYAPYLALLQQMNGGQQPAQAPGAPAQQGQIPDNQLQSILAAINQPAQQPAQQQAPPNQHGYLNPNDNSYQQYMMLQQLAQGQQPPPPPPPPPPANERDWDRDDHQSRRDDRDRDRDRDRDNKDGRRKRATLPPHKPANKALIGTKPCTFWQQGKCARGDKCTFRHD